MTGGLLHTNVVRNDGREIGTKGDRAGYVDRVERAQLHTVASA